MSQMKEAFGQRLRELRKKLGYTQQEMAYAVGKRDNTINEAMQLMSTKSESGPMVPLSKLSWQKSLIAFCVLMLLAGCAARASVQGMTVSAPVTPAFEVRDELKRGISIRLVTGGEETNPLWTSEVGNDEFQAALESSLRNNSLLAEQSPGKYALDAHLIDVQQPLIGFDTKVTSTVQYRLDPVDDDEEPYEELVIESYTATVSESWYGVERLRLANEGSIRGNIRTFIERLMGSYSN